LRAKAAAAGCSVEELIARSEAELARTKRVGELRRDPRSGWLTIARHAAAHDRMWSHRIAE
jgi:hypothetical protein